MKRKYLGHFLLLTLLSISTIANAADGPLTPSRFVQVKGTKVAVYESTGTKGPGVLLVHGNTSSANAFSRVMTSNFAKNMRVVALDLPGYGRSDRRLLYSIDTYKEVIAEVAQVTGVKKGIIVGWSWGGDLVLQASSLLPEAKGFFIFGTAPMGGAPSTAPYSFLTPFESYAGAATLYGTIPVLSKKHIRDYVKAFFAPNYAPIPQMFYEDGYVTDSKTRLTVALAATGLDLSFQQEVPIAQNLRVPLAMVHSTQDAFVRLEYLKAIERSFPTLWRGKTVLIENQGHAVQWENPAAFIQTLQAFMSEI